MEVASENLGQVTLDNLIQKIYAQKIVPEGRVEKINDTSARITTVEGYVFVLTVEGIQYIGNKDSLPKVTGVNISLNNNTIEVDEKFTLTASLTPTDVYDKTINWSTSDASIASISGTTGETITVTGVNSGTASITASSADGSGKSATCTVTVKASPVQLNTLSASHYGDYVDYPVSIGRGPAGIAETHKTDWRIFYNDGTYVYLIASYLLLNSEMPTTTSMTGYSGQPYTSRWGSVPTANASFSSVAVNQYQMHWNKNTTNNNIKCVSELLNTNNWVKFRNATYAEDAIGSPTLEMWVASWNATGGTTLYYRNTGTIGYEMGSSGMSGPAYVSTGNSLYFPGGGYWLAATYNTSPVNYVMCVNGVGSVYADLYYQSERSVRPVVRLKSSAIGTFEDGIWKLK